MLRPKNWILILLLLTSLATAAAPLPTPEQFAGFRMGADKKLLNWDKIVEYMKLAGAASPRIKVEELGKTSMGNPFLTVTISAPETLKDLPRYKANQRRLAYDRGLDEAAADKLIASNKAVMLITCNIHGNEIGSTQMVLDLVYRLATEDSPEIHHILDNVIFVLVPSLNPDGQKLISDWYMKNAGTQWESSPLPELYHKYTGHDNNRDAFMNTQLESKMFNKLAFKDWFPVVYLDEHQMGNSGPRIFVPPFMNPINMNVDPSIWELNGMFGYAMGAALHAKDYTGIINDTQYTSWWQGGFMMQVWWHNAIGLLTEVASVNVATPTDQLKAQYGEAGRAPELSIEQQRGIDPRKPLPAPRDVTPRNSYPRPWLGGHWTLRNIVDYELTATFALLNAVANERTLVQRNFYRLNRKQIALGKTEPPYAYVIPARQHDPAAAALLVKLLDEQGGEVQRAGDAFEAAGRLYPAGSYVVLMSQPFRPFVKDLLEKQTYPVQRQYPGGPVQRPYDVTGWTLPLMMGVEAVEVPTQFSAKLDPVTTFPAPEGKFETAVTTPVAWEISHHSNNSVIATNRLLKAGVNVSWAPNGSIIAYAREDLAPRLKELSQSLSVDIKGLASLPPTRRPLKAPRLALYNPPQGVMDEGWTRWLLEQYEFPYTRVRPAEIRAGKLREHFDAILFPNQPKEGVLNGAISDWIRPEDRGGIGPEGVAALKQFVRDGGTLITLGASGLVPVEDFPLPLKNAMKGLKPDQFSVPGSILKVHIDNSTPVGYGMKESASAVFYNNIAFDPAPAVGESSVKVIARYPASNILDSGWIGGEEFLVDKIAAAQVEYGKGHVILLGFAVQNRAQPHGTFKLLFNAIHLAGATE